MNNPIQIYNELRDTYLKYISSGIPFFNEQYDAERKELLKENGTICQPPIIEIVPKYKEQASLEQFCKNENVSNELAKFVQSGLFYNNNSEKRILYKHQYNALKESYLNRKHIVVTTGTGSGKTECFLLPIIADLISESSSWSTNRPRAMRTMILYPLNALAEDQMIRLRKSLNSRRENHSGALDWLDKYRNGHRFYFGRYTGSTPVSGSADSAKDKIRIEKNQLVEEWKAAKQAASQNEENRELLYHVPCMEKDSAEMWDRLSMQKNAPDILITNYSMLNIMLMRNIEAAIFEDTKRWLAEDKSHVFHLVIDELHTYRGTAGTEVAYLIRVLLDRLGLTPDSPQVQFLASSASMGENKQTSDFLCEFFGVAKDFFKDKFSIFTNDKNGNIVITGIVFSEEGRYILTVEEKKGENAGITYDSTKYNVTVNVKANAEGDLKTEIESIKKKGEEKNENQIVFNNIYTATANFTLTASKSMKAESEQLGTFEFELSGDNIETQTVTNNEAGAITFAPIHYNLSDVGNTYTYTVREKAPSTEAQYKTDGIKYVYDTTVYTVKVKVEDNGDGTLKLTKTVKIGEKDYTDPEMRFVNDTTKATITKVDALGNQLSGVELEVRDKNNEVVDSWTTSTKENPHVITGKLILGETYKLVEKSAPAGYTLADPVEFTVSENDIDNKVEMKNTYSASGSLNLTAKKTLTTTETPLAADQFTFELRDKDGTVLQTKTNDADGNVTFDEIKYSLVKDNTDKKVDNTGEYQYTVNEVKGDAAGYTYDDTIYTINVTVTDAGNGTLTVTPVIHSSKATSEDATVTGMEFTNTYTTSGQIALGAIKTLEGQTLEAEQFSFQATEMDADGKAVENGYNETVKNADGGAITFPIITYKESGTHYYQITEVKDEKPAYQYDESKYVVKVDVTDDNAGKLTAKVTSVTKNGEPVKSEDLTGAVTFTNTYSASADLELKAQKSMKVEAEQLGTFEFELKDADGKVIETVKNDEKGAISFSKLSYTEKDAGKTFTYTVNEKLPSEADTYVYDKTVYTVTVNVEDNRDGTLKLTTKVNGEDYTETAMKFVNDTTKVTISKVDDTTLKALAGAQLQVVDDQDKVVEEWTSDGTPHVITAKLVLGKTYKLVEAEAPSGYEIAEPITFTVDADDTKNAVEMKDAMTKGKTAAIEITKELKLNDALAGAKDMTFYAALFADAECTIPASDVKALEFKNASSSTVTFTNLDLGRTYYVSETDATGKAIDSGMTPDEKVYVPVYPQGQAITVTEDGAKSSITFENQFSEWPDGFYKIATLNVTKKLLGADGNALESDEIFYAGIFDDKECTTLSTRTEKNILTLDLAGGSTVSESTQAVVIPDEAFTLYVAETDAEGNLVDGTDGFRYAVTVENGNVLFDENNLNAEVTIINQEQPEATPTVTPEETITPTPTPGTSTGVKTGDDTPIGFYMALLFVAALAIEETTRRRRKKEQD